MNDFHFPADLQPYVDELLARDRFVHVSELIIEAVYLHRDLELARRHKHEELKREIQIGIDQADRGQVAPLDMDAIWQRVLEKLGQTAGAT
jgi:antitoxin ParD1/3/4